MGIMIPIAHIRMTDFIFSDKKHGLTGEMLDVASFRLKQAGYTDAGSSVKQLVFGICGSDMPFSGYLHVTEEELVELECGISRMLNGEPVQYITKIAPFWKYDFYIEPGVLIPRFDTETLVEAALKHIKDGQHVLDLCTGSGCIGLTIASEKNVILDAVDISEISEKVFTVNAEKIPIKCKPVFHSGDVFDDVFCHKLSSSKFDIIVSNPPYINADDMNGLSEQVKAEPEIALFGGEDGLDFYKRIIPLSASLLKNGGHLFLEIGFDQGDSVRSLAEESGFITEIIKDLSGNDRVIHGQYTAKDFFNDR